MSWTVRRFESQKGQKHFLLQNHPDRLGGPPGLLSTKYWDSSPEQKEAGREFDYSPPPTIEVANKWSCTSTPAVCLHDINREAFTSSSFIVEIYQSDIGFKQYAFWHVSPSRQNMFFQFSIYISLACRYTLQKYTGCTRRNVRDFGRVFLMLNYTDITQNTYIQSWTVTEIMAIEKCGLWGVHVLYAVRDAILVHYACPATRHH